MSEMVQIDGTDVAVSHLDKVFYPETEFTKGQVIDYYVRVAPVLLPHLRDRAISLKRYPDGVDGKFFFEKQCPSHAPKWITTTRVAKSDGGRIDYCVIDDLRSLVWAANVANLELHPFQHSRRAPARPTAVVFDLDPGPPADILNCCRVAEWIRDALDALGLTGFPKTSGSKGLQLVVPINRATSYDATKTFAHTLAQLLEREHPDEVVSRMAKNLRAGKIFIDWSQNDAKKTTVAAYSLRARPTPTVSTPVTWAEIRSAVRRKVRLSFTSVDVLARIERHGDHLAPAVDLQQALPKL